jgi:Mg2+ and Co2+ transporter CorA
MNFNMPPAPKWQPGYPMALVRMRLAAAGAVNVLQLEKWL